MPTPETKALWDRMIGTLTEADCARVRKERDRHVKHRGVWYAWNRILDAVETAKLAQEAIDASEVEDACDRDAVSYLPNWIPTGGTV